MWNKTGEYKLHICLIVCDYNIYINSYKDLYYINISVFYYIYYVLDGNIYI